VRDGGFSSLQLSYPSPHTAPRRNFTLYPFENMPSVFQEFFPDPDKMANSSFLATVIAQILETSPGDFKGFQEAIETFEVRKETGSSATFLIGVLHQGPHGSVHLIMGG
jgi:hypothetical protein